MAARRHSLSTSIASLHGDEPAVGAPLTSGELTALGRTRLFGATGTVLCRYELALTKRRYEVLPTYNAKGNAGDDLLDLLDIGYAYVGSDDEGKLPERWDDVPGKVPARFKADLAKRLTNIQA